jgi:hypothetical protein
MKSLIISNSVAFVWLSGYMNSSQFSEILRFFVTAEAHHANLRNCRIAGSASSGAEVLMLA